MERVATTDKAGGIKKKFMLLYFHVPFCRAKCAYCGFYSEPLSAHSVEEEWGSAQSDRLQLWLDTLLYEMASYADALGKVPVETIFFGGGTPTIVPPSIIATILDKAAKYFRIAPTAEISMEANPESVDRENAAGYFKAGINRVSLGIQSLDDNLLPTLGRIHTSMDALRAYNAIRAAGFANVGFDLMWGLPGQTVSNWLATLQEVKRLRPEHLSCYGLTIEEDTLFYAFNSAGTLDLPTERDQAFMYMRGAELLEEAGFLQYEISNFARMGYACRHNVGYWEGVDYLGLGPSATSTINGIRWSNPRSIDEWRTLVARRSLMPEKEILTNTERVLELVMLRLRTTRGLRLKAYTELTGRNFLQDHKPLIHALVKNSLVRIRHGYINLTRSGMLVSNSILEHLFRDVRRVLGGDNPPQTPLLP